MKLMAKVDRFFGVMPPNTSRRLGIGLTFLFVAVAANMVALMGQSLKIQVPLLTPELVNMLLVLSLLFGVSLVYYIIMPGKEKKVESAYSLLE